MPGGSFFGWLSRTGAQLLRAHDFAAVDPREGTGDAFADLDRHCKVIHEQAPTTQLPSPQRQAPRSPRRPAFLTGDSLTARNLGIATCLVAKTVQRT
jgi:hypothetical protein